jgi:hypothetical protein
VVLAAVVAAAIETRPALHAMEPLGFREAVNYLAKDGLLAGGACWSSPTKSARGQL